MKIFDSAKDYCKILENITPIKITECRRMKLNAKSWSIITDYVIESVKISRYREDDVVSTAILQISDVSGQVTCLLKGRKISVLFGLTEDEWSEIENMCANGEQLFYRNFKAGHSYNFKAEQKIFYNFCHTNQTRDVVIAIFCRTYNTRNKDKNDAFLHITHLIKQNSCLLELYTNYLRKS